MVNLFIAIVLGVTALLGFITGLIKGYNKLNTWASEFLLSSLVTILAGIVLKKTGLNQMASGIILIACAVLSLLLFVGLSGLVRTVIENKFIKKEDELEEYGAVSVVNRVLGGINQALKAFTIACIVIVPVLLILDFAQIEMLKPYLEDVYSSAAWTTIQPHVFDLVIIGFLQLSIRHGFATGISGSLWSLLVLAFVAGAGYLAYHLVFNVGVFNSASEALGGTVSGWLGSVQIGGEGLPLTIAKWIITAGIFLLLLIVILVVSHFMTRIINTARLSDAFYVADGIGGAFVMACIALAVMLVLGFILQPLSELDFMSEFNRYFGSGNVADYFYIDNLLAQFGVPQFLPLKEWLS